MKITRIDEAMTSTQDLIEELSQYQEMKNVGMFTNEVHREMVRVRIADELSSIADEIRTINSDSDFPKFQSVVKAVLEIKRLGVDSEYSSAIGNVSLSSQYKTQLDKIQKASVALSQNHRELFNSWMTRPEVLELVKAYAKYTK